MKKVIFICRGNMFRSQIATAIYNRLSTDGSIAYGYGTAVEQEGREGRLLSSYPELAPELEFMKAKGMDISENSCHQVNPQSLEGASKIILMSEKEYIPEWLKSYPYEYWQIPNPSSLNQQIVQDTYDLLYKKITNLLKTF